MRRRGKPNRVVVAMAMVLTAAGVTSTPANAATETKRCGPEAPGGRCGTVTVPLDRADPAAGNIRIGFEHYPQRPGTAASGTILAIPDGPGLSATSFRGAFFEIFGAQRRDFGLLLVDRRGTGKSQAINCPGLQTGKVKQSTAVTRCGAKLAAASDRYGAADIAADIEAVRDALGLVRLDIYGTAYGAVDALAYTTRYPSRVRSLTLASPVPPVGRDPFNTAQAAAALRAIEDYCNRSRACRRAGEDPRAVFAELVARLRTAPVQGRGPGRDGRLRRVTVTEATLVDMVRNTRGDMITHGELTAAAVALLRNGDRAPLVRLAAEAAPLAADRDEGPADEFSSMGAQAAAFCTDSPLPWDPRASRAIRLAQYEAARSALPADAFGPFSVAAWTADFFGPWDGSWDLVGSGTAYRVGPCVDWPAPDRAEPPLPGGVTLSGIPTLVLVSDTSVHSPREDADRMIAAVVPHARRVEIAGMDHLPAIVEPCVAAIVDRFVRALDPGETASCGPDPGGPWYAPGEFPRTAADAQPARIGRAAGNQARLRERRIAEVAVRTVMDAYYHGSPGEEFRPALRGGSFRITESRDKPQATIAFRRARFASDVWVSGRIRIDFGRGQAFAGRLRLSGPAVGRRCVRTQISGRVPAFAGRVGLSGAAVGRRCGRIRISGRFYSAPDQPVRVSGEIRGRQAALLVDVY